ncbi:hypothetical protein ANABIO32_15520 [Rossellomorea marisflavi]|uniref:DUF1672 family protein n=1 Tax=Rossellomorea marisflavi TaxID=189381 RepID=UPI0025CB3DD1|nr:DUF1672 family protein [Rossellomorea marisflavi]UTE71809.1 DUF1672 domain-containing protein [Rossellomorea marisflavi]GLI83855.1 hypothetical protein ANABIO32_15520 [Rossellomorea marisflavi]
MKHKWKLFVCGISISLLLGGCFGVDSGKKSEAKKTDAKQGVDDRPEDRFESVLTYTGEGYDLPGGEENEKIAKEHKDEVVKATKDYLKEKYNTDIEVHNMVGNKDGVTVFFESVGDVHFYSTAIVPIDSDNQKVLSDKVWTLEGEVEKAIRASLYAYIDKDDFENLDNEIKDIINSNPEITGRTIESLQNVGGNGYMTPYYFVQSSSNDEAIKPVYDSFINNPTSSITDLRKLYDKDLFKSKDLIFSINFFMKDSNLEPDKKIYDSIVQAFEDNDQLPRGTYVINLHDNFIIKSKFEGYKQNSLSQTALDGIIKE